MGNKKIGFLDFGMRDQMLTHNYNHLIYEATVLEKYGFSRIWYTQHYVNSYEYMWLSPEMIFPIVAAYTKNIKIGIAGVLSLYKNPIQVASNFKLLNNIFKGRIDLGFAKGGIAGRYADYFDISTDLSDEARREKVTSNIKQTIGLLSNESENFANGLAIPPVGGTVPEFWNLVASPRGYADSLSLGVNCSRTLFHKNVDLDYGLYQLEKYREDFFKSYGMLPQTNIVVAGTCQKTDRQWRKLLQQAKEKNTYFNDDTKVFGTPNQVFDQISKLMELYNVDEVIFLETSRDDKNRLSSIKNISKVFSLTDSN